MCRMIILMQMWHVCTSLKKQYGESGFFFQMRQKILIGFGNEVLQINV